MFTAQDLRERPVLIKASMGWDAKVFWQLIADMQAKLPEYERERLERPDRQRAIGGGRDFDLPLTACQMDVRPVRIKAIKVWTSKSAWSQGGMRRLVKKKSTPLDGQNPIQEAKRGRIDRGAKGL